MYIYICISKNNCGISIYRYNLNIMINLSYFNPYEFDKREESTRRKKVKNNFHFFLY